MMTAGRIARHRNYGELMARHEHEQKIRRVTRIVIYFILIAFLIILFVMVTRWNSRPGNTEQQEPVKTSMIAPFSSLHL
jgi:large-conductance mechanosensitive channel